MYLMYLWFTGFFLFASVSFGQANQQNSGVPKIYTVFLNFQDARDCSVDRIEKWPAIVSVTAYHSQIEKNYNDIVVTKAQQVSRILESLDRNLYRTHDRLQNYVYRPGEGPGGGNHHDEE